MQSERLLSPTEVQAVPPNSGVETIDSDRKLDARNVRWLPYIEPEDHIILGED